MPDNFLNILLIEDNPGDARLIQEMLKDQRRFSYDLTHFLSLSAGLRHLFRKETNVVLLDLSLPDSNGLDTFNKMQSQVPQVPIIVLTGLNNEEVATTAVRRGAQDYLVKGEIDGNLLTHSIYYAIERKKVKEALQKANDELEIQVERRTFELMRTNEKLKNEIEERKCMEQALRESEERYRNLVENVDLGIVLIDAEHNILMTNTAHNKIFNTSKHDSVGKKCFHELEHRTAVCPNCLVAQAMTTGHPVEAEKEGVKNDGSRFYVRVQVFPILRPDAAAREFIAVIEDITQKKHLQDQLIRSERLIATGQLAASIAHEINSPLQAITVMLSMLKKKYNEDEKLVDNLEILKGAFTSIKDTVKNLLDLNRPGKEVKQRININKTIEKTIDLTRSHLKRKRIGVNLDLSSTVPDMMASPQQLSQLFLNLINNAVEAICGVSQSQGEWKQNTLTERKITITTHLNKENIVINISDTGPGISGEDLNHIFDPFYTRKKRMGMGIGLSVCHGIIKDHNGTIAAENSSQGGTIFTIKLPKTQ